MSELSHIKFGDGLAVTDEGSGVIRVDAEGEGIQFDTSPQEGGFLEITTIAAGGIGISDTGATGIVIQADRHVHIAQNDAAGSGLSLVASGSYGIQMETQHASSVIQLMSAGSVALIPGAGPVTLNGNKIDMPTLPTTDPGVSGRLWNSGGDVVLSGFTTPPAPSGALLNHTEKTTNVSITANTEASPTVIITASAAVTVNGSTPICVEFYAPTTNATAATFMILNLWDDTAGVSLGRIWATSQGGPTVASIAIFARRFFTPAAGTRTYSVRGWATTASGWQVIADVGGTTQYMPMYLRITTA